MRKIGYIAVDLGPELTLRALSARLPGDWSRSGEPELLVCGTSDTSGGRAIEAAARRAARRRGASVVVVEDFPGSYVAVPGGEPKLVVVESEFAAGLARAKEGALRTGVCPGVRYDGLRRRLAELRRGPESERAVLWIGQPETSDSVKTLRRLLPALVARGTRVWFRAHPRDEGYARGAYAGLPVEDVTSLPLDECFARRPRAAMTQFSSAAIEAGFWGIPSLNVLFPDAGARALRAKKGYSVPPWCNEGAAFLIESTGEIDQTLDSALLSAQGREQVLQAFDRYFKVADEGAPALINLLYNQGLL